MQMFVTQVNAGVCHKVSVIKERSILCLFAFPDDQRCENVYQTGVMYHVRTHFDTCTHERQNSIICVGFLACQICSRVSELQFYWQADRCMVLSMMIVQKAA